MTHPNNHALSQKQIEVLRRALEIAWHRFLQIGMMDANIMAEAQQISAQRTINSTTEGECDPWRLAREALFHLWEVRLIGGP
jgi:acetolactate synthase regulatory subunit